MNTETTTGFKCPKPACKDKSPFKSKQALNMHTMRVHTLAGRQGAMWASKRKPASKPDAVRELFLEKKRAYNKTLRDKNIAQGLTSTGKIRKRSIPGGAVRTPSLWTTDRNEYKRQWYQKKKAEKNLIRIVYPDPRDTEQPSEQNKPMNYCPECGHNLEQYRK